ncbi:MAG: FHA domain-containing protein [Actinomycetaceae bacterium]|nr:FHA domain-containing protein [Arcanobacterium sp.]MDD7505111.1 FHA domain-containing protein [Actinomycetaceae bacterium]MDY6142628.1 FHA domain-containing protein [Arcanobacterium sp.]
MNALIITVLRFAFLLALWLFVFFVVVTVKNDVYGPTVTSRGRTNKAARKSAPKQASPSNSAGAYPEQNSREPNPHSTLGTPEAHRLIVVQGPLAGTALSLRAGSILVGRSPDSSLVLDDGYASSRHARFYVQGGDVIVEDLQSTNGTWLNGERIYQPTVLQPRVPVTIGKTVLELAQ